MPNSGQWQVLGKNAVQLRTDNGSHMGELVKGGPILEVLPPDTTLLAVDLFGECVKEVTEDWVP